MSAIARCTIFAATLVAGCQWPTFDIGSACGVDIATGIDTCQQQPPPANQPGTPPTPPPAVVRVTPAQVIVSLGDTIRFVAVPYDSLNRVFVEPSQVVWSISDSTVASIVEGPVHFDYKSGNSTAVTLLGVSPGTAVLTVTVIVNNGGLRTSGTASVTTNPSP